MIIHIFPLIIEGIVATACMTAFDYALALVSGKRIKVVKILGTMLTDQTTPDQRLSEQPTAILIGIIAHYGVGVVFSLAFHWLWRHGIGAPTIPSAVAFGAVSGILAVVVWRTFIALHPRPPAISLKSFLWTIFWAHIIFGVMLVATHQLIS